MTSSNEEKSELYDAIELMKTESFSEMPQSPDRVPRGIEVDENRVYFYCTVGQNEALELNRLITNYTYISRFIYTGLISTTAMN